MTFDDALENIPVFPLPNVVLFPGAAMPLHIFEPRYRVMLKDALASHRALVIAQLDGGVDDDGLPTMAKIAGGGVIVEHHELPDGRSNILVMGQARVRLDSISPPELPRYPYRRARASVIRDLDVVVSEQDKAALVAAATMFAAEVKKHDASFSFVIPPAAAAAELADVCAYQLVVDPAERQALLADLDPRSRVDRVTRQLAFQQSSMMRAGGGKVLN